MTLSVFSPNQTPQAPIIDSHRRERHGSLRLGAPHVAAGGLPFDSDWIEAWHPTTRLSYATVLRSLRLHQSRCGARIDVGFLPKPDGTCHLVGQRGDILKALNAVAESTELCPSGWRVGSRAD